MEFLSEVDPILMHPVLYLVVVFFVSIRSNCCWDRERMDTRKLGMMSKFNLYMYISEESSLNFDFKNLKQNCSTFFTTHSQTSEYFSNFQKKI